jgi:glycosyltransferase involved in cell wall biosynthesis
VNNSKTILFDGRFISLNNAGLGRYSSELLKNLLDQASDEFKFILLILPGTKFDEELKSSIAKNQKKVEVIEFGAKHYSVSEQTKLKNFLAEIKPDLVHFTNLNHPVFYKGKFVVTIHDLTLFQYAERASFLRKAAYNYVIKKAAQNSEKILTVSEFAKKEIIKKFDLEEDKVIVTYNGIDKKFRKITSPKALERVEKYKLNRPYFLYVGQWRSHKNLLTLARAFKKVLDGGFGDKIDLVFTGKIDPKYPELIEEIKRLGIENNIKLTGFVEDEDLPVIYNNALAFVFPSLSEGFGLPALEAQACSLPVISSTSSSLPEVLGEGALFFNPNSVSDLSKKMIEVIKDPKLKSELIEKGLKNVQRFSWDNTAQKTLEVYRELLYK